MTKMLKVSDELFEALQILKPHPRASFDEVIRSLITENDTEDIRTEAIERQVENERWKEEAKQEAEFDEYLKRKMTEVDEHVNQKIKEIEAAAIVKTDAWARGEIEITPSTSHKIVTPAKKRSAKK
jgi:predicted CopG family antitoxin